MRWTPGDRSNIEDARGRSGVGLRGGVPIGIGGLLVLMVLSWATGTNFLSLLSGGDATLTDRGSSGTSASSPAEERQVDFVDAVMKDVQDTWRGLLGDRYQPTRAVLFQSGITCSG